MRDHRPQRRLDIGAADVGQRVDRAERADHDFARGQARHQRDADLPVEAQRREDVIQACAEHAGEAVADRRSGGPGGRRRIARQEPHQHHQRQDDGADARQKDLRALPQPGQQIAQRGPVVFRQLHQQRVVAGAHRGALHHQRHQHRADHAGDVEREQHQALQVERSDAARRNEGADDQRVHRQARRAGHDRRHHDRRQPVALTLGMVRVAMIPGIAHENDDSSGMKERPESPTPPISRSSRKAARGR